MGYFGGQKEVAPREFDPLYSQSGAQPIRTGIFNALPNMAVQATGDANAAAAAAQQGAAAMRPVAAYGNALMGGKYLNSSPALDRSLSATRAASDAAAGNAAATARANLQATQAATRSQFSRAGQTFGTANQLAQEGTSAALEAQSARNESERQAALNAAEAGAKAQNYMNERGLQTQGAGIAQAGATKPVELLQAVPGLRYAGVSPAVEVIRGLASGAPVVNPNTYYKPGAFDYTMQGIGALGSAASAF